MSSNPRESEATPVTDPERRAATVELVEATRALMLAVATTDLPVDDLVEATKSISGLADLLGTETRTRVLRTSFELPAELRGAGEPWRTYGVNPFGIPLEIHFDGDTARATLVGDALLEGPPDHLHGGFSAHLMDCLLGSLVQGTGERAVTGTLDLRYLSRTPLDAPLDLHAEITGRSGRKIHAVGWIEHEGVRCVEATGLFITIDGVHA
ncbi:PaaI family thioesterase [Nocardioides sp. Root140]|uniref:PaaI family thioesterase n=1 Tax=Nocardioides sp. Root140 TaxID=1736460 RepID=UPI0019100B49|nr:PaaI family thioesterase [Nocardioides sp. Root140]